MSSIYVGHSAPEPDSDVETRYRAELQSIDSLLDIKWVEHVVFNRKYNTFEGRYAVVCHFPADDPRRAYFQRGEMDNDYEILCWIARDVQNAEVPADPAHVWPAVLKVLNSADNSKNPIKRRMAEIAQRNINLRERNKRDFLDGVVHDDASYNRTRNLGNTIVNVPREI